MNRKTIERGEQLNSCPFCGGEARLFDASGTRFKPAVTCMNCTADMPARTTEQAIAAWNRRVPALAKAQPAPAGDGSQPSMAGEEGR